MSTSCHDDGTTLAPAGERRIALVGSPNAGKTSVFNHLTGMRARTGNYPGVTVVRSVGTGRHDGEHWSVRFTVEDLPGCYSLHPVSPDEQVVSDLLHGRLDRVEVPEALAVVIDVTVLERSLSLLAQVLRLDRPTMVILTMTDELTARGGQIDIGRFSAAVGVPAVGVIGSRGAGFGPLRELLAAPQDWSRVPVPPPEDGPEYDSWAGSVLASAAYRLPDPDSRTARIDRVLLHPVLGSLVFIAVMFLVFQAIFTLAAPLQGLIESLFGWLGPLVGGWIPNDAISALVSEGIIGGVGAVLVFIPQIALLFLLIAVLENTGYMARAAFLVDRIMATTGLEGRAFVAMLSSVACAIPGIMATRTLPSARDRIATIMAAPLMPCAARLPVYVLLIGLLVDSGARVGPFSAQGVAMFGMYVLGGVIAMATAWLFKATVLRGDLLPFYMEMPPYRVPTLTSVMVLMLDAVLAFVKRAGTVILTTTIVLWLLLNLPARTAQTVGMDDAAAAAYVVDNSFAAAIGQFIQPVFEPLGFDWRICVGLLGALAAREVFVATMGQIFAAVDPEQPLAAVQSAVWTSGPAQGELLFSPATTVALLVFFAFALLCMSTVAIIRRETNSWRWPLIAFGYMLALAWIGAFIARHLTLLIAG